MMSPRIEADVLDLGEPSAFNENPTAAPSTELEQLREHSARIVPLLVWVATVLTLVLIPLKVISYGYLPPDDGLRHAAKAVSGREWSDIIVLQDQFKMDHNPGWHCILGAVHRLTGAGVDELTAIEVCALALLVLLAALPWMKRPEAWIAALLASAVIFPDLIHRVFVGRPFSVSTAATLAILLLWRDVQKPATRLLLLSTVLFALGTWIHGSWYLFALVVAAFGLAGQWRSSICLAGCWLVGAFVGGVLTGHPVAFLWNAIRICINCFGNNQLQRMLVGEFGPSEGEYPAVLFTGILIVARGVRRGWDWKAINNPIFILIVLGWILGLRVVRFWVDWGLPALALWTALELQEFLAELKADSIRRLVIAGGLCAALFFGITSDIKGRWTQNLTIEYLSQQDPEMKEWLPEDGGIIYSAYMGVFYDTFFKNPNAKWKYILGFESTFMPTEDLRILRNIQWNRYAHKAHEPWVAKMRRQDRMVIYADSSSAPAVQGLEWKYIARNTWIGRLPGSH
jgi:hypothetical protein